MNFTLKNYVKLLKIAKENFKFIKFDEKFDINEKENTLKIESTIETTGKTGVEMEALTAASVAALTVYDMCKSVDKEIKIKISLVSKKGGKSGDVFFN